MDLVSYEFLPAPLWLVTVLHVITLTVHLAAMNLLLGGTAVILLARIDDRWQRPGVRRVVKVLPSAMAATITFGVAPLLFLQLVYHRQAYTSAIVGAWYWLGILVVALVAYYLLYAAAPHADDMTPRRPRLLGWALAGFLYIAFVYTSVFALVERPQLAHDLYAASQSGWSLNPELSTTLPRWLHMVLGAVMVGGVWVGWIGRDDEAVFAAARRAVLWGGVLASVAGVVYLLSLGPALRPLMRGAGIWWLTVSVVVALGALHFFWRRRFGVAGGLLAVSLLGMVATRHIVRDLQLTGHFDPATLPVNPQWSVFALFLACLVLAVVLLVTMARWFLRSDPGAAA